MSYIALYRKWRPMLFEDVVGQSHVTQTLKNEIKTNRISHAYIFSGTRGTGKTSTAKIFSRAVNCKNPINGNPCNECENCTGILNNNILDVAEIDAASNNSVDDIRALRDDVNYSPSGLAYKIYIIDEVHMLSTSAFNALLKTLEEPPSNVIFILATTEIHKIPVTILSRCQRFDFKRIDAFHIKQRLEYITRQENLRLNDDALMLLARAADGSMRDALSILDQCISMDNREITLEDILKIIGTVDISHLFKLTDYMLKKDINGALLSSDELIKQGRDLSKLCTDLISHLRNLLICKITPNSEEIIDFGFEYLRQYQEKSAYYTVDNLIYFIQLFSRAQADMKYAANKRAVFEIAFIKACQPNITYDIEGVLSRLSVLEDKFNNGNLSSLTCNSDITENPNNKKIASAVKPPYEKESEIKPIKPETTNTITLNNDQNFETRYWADIIAKINDPGISSIIHTAKPEIKGDILYLLFDDEAFLDILKSSQGELTVQQIAATVCNKNYTVKALLKNKFTEEIQNNSAENRVDPFTVFLKKAENLGGKTTIIHGDGGK